MSLKIKSKKNKKGTHVFLDEKYIVHPEENPIFSEKITREEVFIGEDISVAQDNVTHYPFIGFPFSFPDGTKGQIVVIRLKDEVWKPAKTMSSISINFKFKA